MTKCKFCRGKISSNKCYCCIGCNIKHKKQMEYEKFLENFSLVSSIPNGGKEFLKWLYNKICNSTLEKRDEIAKILRG